MAETIPEDLTRADYMGALMQNEALQYLPQLVQVGGFGRNDGKTTLACAVVAQLCKVVPVVAVKLVCVDEHKGACHKTQGGCGLCGSLQGAFDWREENNQNSKKDTVLLKKAGAEHSYLLRSRLSCLEEAFMSFVQKEVPKEAVVVCESNRLRLFINPAVFLFAAETMPPTGAIKPGATELCKLANRVVLRGETAPYISFHVHSDLRPHVFLEPQMKE